MTTRQQPALTWRDDWDPVGGAEAEIEAYLSSLTPTMRSLREGEILALRNLAAKGLIVEEDESKFSPVIRFPDLYELKWRFRQKGKPDVNLRQYHLEPSSFPRHLVATHRHLKDTSGTKAQVRAAQNGQMAIAQMRAVGRASKDWGL